MGLFIKGRVAHVLYLLVPFRVRNTPEVKL